jgi:spore maturation protein CgeB
MELLRANLEALRRADPTLAERLSRPATDAAIETFTARSGALSIRLDGVPEASAEDPEAEARQLATHFAERARQAGATRLVLFGLGVHTLRFLESVDGSCLVIEPSLALLRAVLQHIDLSRVLERIQLVVGEDPAGVARHPLFTASERGLFLAHPSARRRAPALHDALAQRFHPGGVPSPLDIAVIPPLYGGAVPVAQASARALTELGHRVRDIDLSPFWPAYQAVLRTASDERLTPLSESLRAGLIRVIGEMLVGSFQLDPPDLVFAVAGAPLDLETLQRFEQLGITRALWFCEDFRVMSYWSDVASHYDTIFHVQPESFSEPLRQSGAYGVPLPMAFDPSLHRPIELSSEDRNRYECDLSFVGAGYHNRRHFLPALISLGLRIYGTEWPLSPPFPEAMPEPNVRQSSENANRIFNASRINLNLHSSPWCDGVNPVGDFVNPRTFELAGARSFQLVDDRSELPRFFSPGSELETFANIDECRAKIRYYVEHPNERSEIASAGYHRALSDHTYRHRMEAAMDALSAGPIPLIPRRRIYPTVGSVLAVAENEPGLRRVLERIDANRVVDSDAISLAVASGDGPLTRDEKLLLFMREARGEVGVRNDAGDRA